MNSNEPTPAFLDSEWGGDNDLPQQIPSPDERADSPAPSPEGPLAVESATTEDVRQFLRQGIPVFDLINTAIQRELANPPSQSLFATSQLVMLATLLDALPELLNAATGAPGEAAPPLCKCGHAKESHEGHAWTVGDPIPRHCWESPCGCNQYAPVGANVQTEVPAQGAEALDDETITAFPKPKVIERYRSQLIEADGLTANEREIASLRQELAAAKRAYRDCDAELERHATDRVNQRKELEQARAILRRVRDGKFIPNYGTGYTEGRRVCMQLIKDIDTQLAARAQGEPAKEDK